MKYKVIDNFLDQKVFDSMSALFIGKQTEPMYQELLNRVGGQFPWYLDTTGYDRAGAEGYPADFSGHNKHNLYYMRHALYEDYVPKSPLFDVLLPLLSKLRVLGLICAKANLYPNTRTIYEHAMHCDYYPTSELFPEAKDNYPSPCTSAIFSLNTCDGYTKLKDGTKINSVANRVLLHDPNVEHCGTSTTNDVARFVINMNYMQGVSYV